jgi:hypothetical protein
VKTFVLKLSEAEHEALRRLAYERRVSLAKLVREAVDEAYGTEHSEIRGPGRSPAEEAR